MNVFICTGNLGNNAEQRATKSGDAVTQFNVAFTSGFGDKKQTTWMRCTMWGKRGESLAPYLIKGQQVCVSGEISLHTWQKDGVDKTSLEMRVNDVTLVGGKATGVENKPPQQKASAATDEFYSDSIPF